VLFPIGAINFVAGSYQTIIKELSKTVEKPTIFDVVGSKWENSLSIKVYSFLHCPQICTCLAY
jgi:hypothetical protein